MRRLIIVLLIAMTVILPGFAVSQGPATVHQAAAYEANCSWGGFNPSFGSAASSAGMWMSCTTNATSGRYRAIQVCWYQDGTYLGCNYQSTTGTYREAWYTHSSWGTMEQHRFQAWYWFRDQYGATSSYWGGNFYANKRCI